MKKYKEIMFLLNLPRIGKATILHKYSQVLSDGMNLDTLIEYVRKIEKNISELDIYNAQEIANNSYKKAIQGIDYSIITFFDDIYPDRLRDLKGKAPLVLYAKGALDILSRPSIAIIGTRKPSVWSEKVEENLVHKIIELSDRVIISGLAHGCDYIAHKVTVDRKHATIAVLPCGFNNICPKNHMELVNQIIHNGGCIISEYEPEQKPTPATYVERDGIIAALSDAALIIECNENSGTMHTVNAAYKMKRPLACYYCTDNTKGSYEGNYLIAQKMHADKISDTDLLKLFLENISTKSLIEESIKQLSLKDIGYV